MIKRGPGDDPGLFPGGRRHTTSSWAGVNASPGRESEESDRQPWQGERLLSFLVMVVENEPQQRQQERAEGHHHHDKLEECPSHHLLGAESTPGVPVSAGPGGRCAPDQDPHPFATRKGHGRLYYSNMQYFLILVRFFKKYRTRIRLVMPRTAAAPPLPAPESTTARRAG